MANSLAVTIASDQSAIPVTLSGIGTVTVDQGTSPWVVSGTVTANQGTSPWVISAASLPLPTGAATSALQTTGNASLAAIQAALTNPLPVSLPSGAQAITSLYTNTSGTVAAGATSVGFVTDATFVGTINGAARAASTFYGFSSTDGKTLPAINYTVTAGNITIDSIV